MSNQDSRKNLIFVNTLCSCIEFSGENCVDFLNNLLISDLKSLKHNVFNYSALCNPKGRIISSLWINIKDKNNVLTICPNNMLEELITFFNMRKFRLKINIVATNDSILMDQNGSIIVSDTVADNIDSEINKFYEVLFKINLPWINKENTEKFIPQHLNLDLHENVMSFKKGCYPGQEIIARMKFLGKIKKRMKIIENTSKEKLVENLKPQNQVSPIIESNNQFLVQSIEKIPEIEV